MWQMFISVWVGDVYTLVQHPVVFESLISHLRGRNIAKAVLMCLFYLCTFIWALAVVSKANVAPRPPILHSQSTCFLSLLPVNSVNV